MYSDFLMTSEILLAEIDALEGKTLGCWCSSQEECHLDVIINIFTDENTPFPYQNPGVIDVITPSLMSSEY